MKKKRTITLTNRSYQPKKAELEEKIKVNVPGDTVEEQMNNFADAILRPVKIQFSRKK